jgi:Fur family ferric uptake transcriptional regulator
MKPAFESKRLPKNYQLVLDVLAEHAVGRHVTIADVHILAKTRRSSIGLSTIYRALERLEAQALVCKIVVPGGDTAHYEMAADSHAHFHCEACGRLEDIEYRVPPTTVKRLARSRDVSVREASVYLRGRCAACRTSEA